MQQSIDLIQNYWVLERNSSGNDMFKVNNKDIVASSWNLFNLIRNWRRSIHFTLWLTLNKIYTLF